MVKNLFNFLNREINGLHEAAYLLGFFAICSQVLALFRDRILAGQFGAGNVLDLYYSAFRIPDLIFVTVASVVSISVLIPFLVNKFNEGEYQVREFINSIFSFFFLLILFISVVVFIFTPKILSWLFPVFNNSSSFKELVWITRILLFSPVFLGCSNLLASITQVHRRFFIYALSPVVYNIGIIFGIVFLYPVWGLVGLGFGVVVGAFLHFAIQIPFAHNQNLLPQFSFRFNFRIIKDVVFTSIPRTITVSSGEISKLFLVVFASYFISGSVSIFNFSLNLQSVPFSIIGVSYSLAAFPTLTRLFSRGNIDEFLKQIIDSTRHIIFWSIPVSVLFIVLRAQIVRTILGAGEFSWNDTRLTAASLALFVVSLLAQNMVTLFVRSYYSQGKTKIPLIMNVFSAFFIILSTIFFVKLFNSLAFFRDFIESLLKVSDIPGTVVLMLPLGFTFGYIINLIIYWIDFNRQFKIFTKSILKVFFHIFGASIIMGFVTYESLKFFDGFLSTDTLFGIFMQGLFSGLTGIISAIIVLYLLKNEELKEVWWALHRKIWKAKIVVPDPEL